MNVQTGRVPIINAPRTVTTLALSIAAAHLVRVACGPAVDAWMLDAGAVFPARFWPWTGLVPGNSGVPPYSNALQALFPLLGTAFLHQGWSHLLINDFILLGVGKPVYLALSGGKQGTSWRFLAVFLLSVLGGSVAHLLAGYPHGAPAIGASGGVAGFIAIVLLLQQRKDARVVSRQFGIVVAVFAALNVAMAFVGPSLVGGEIAWQAHIGGFVAGAVAFQWLRPKPEQRRPAKHLLN